MLRDTNRSHADLQKLTRKIQEYAPQFLKETTIIKEDIEALIQDEVTAYVMFNVTRFGTVIFLLARIDDVPCLKKILIERFTTETMEETITEWAEALDDMKSCQSSDEIFVVRNWNSSEKNTGAINLITGEHSGS